MRVAELGEEIARDYACLEPVLVAPLKASVVFLTDLSRALATPHSLDFMELAGYAAMGLGGWLAFGPMAQELAPVAAAGTRYAAVLVFSMVGGMIPGTLFVSLLSRSPQNWCRRRSFSSDMHRTATPARSSSTHCT